MANEQDTTGLIYTLYKLYKNGKYPTGSSEEELTNFLTENESEVQTYLTEYQSIAPEDLQNDSDFVEFYNQIQPQQEDTIAYAKNGAKLTYLKKLKKGGKSKKCSCGCEMITKKDAGGKLTSTCACNCKGGTMPKKASGGEILKYQNPIAGLAASQQFYNQSKMKSPDRKTKVVTRVVHVQKPKTTPKQNIDNTVYGDETWEVTGTGNDSMNPKDWSRGTTSSWGTPDKSPKVEKKSTTTNSKPTAPKSTPSKPSAPVPKSGNTSKADQSASSGNKQQAKQKTVVTQTAPKQKELGVNTDLSIVDYMASEGMDYSKENRARVAKELGIENYDFSAKKNLELLKILKARNTVKDPEIAPIVNNPKTITQVAPIVIPPIVDRIKSIANASWNAGVGNSVVNVLFPNLGSKSIRPYKKGGKLTKQK